MFFGSASALPTHATRAHGPSGATHLCVSLVADSASNFAGSAPTPGEGRQIYPSTGGTRWLSWGVVGLSVIMLGLGVLWYFLPYKKSILVPAGTFWMGCDVQTDSQCEDDEKPGVEVGVAAFSIDRYEVTVTE